MRKTALLLVSLCLPLWPQADVSSIRGAIRDASGAAIPGVQVRVTNLQTNVSRSVVAEENGDYEFIDLRRGAYRIDATKPGFKTFVADNVILESRQIRRVDLTMEVGQVDTRVEVAANITLGEDRIVLLATPWSRYPLRPRATTPPPTC